MGREVQCASKCINAGADTERRTPAESKPACDRQEQQNAPLFISEAHRILYLRKPHSKSLVKTTGCKSVFLLDRDVLVTSVGRGREIKEEITLTPDGAIRQCEEPQLDVRRNGNILEIIRRADGFTVSKVIILLNK